jgi:hypothetical protein
MKETYLRNGAIAGAVVTIILIGFLVFALTRSSSPPTTKTNPATATQTQSKSSKPRPSGESAAGQNSSGNSSALSDSGPGDVVALFVLASITGYGIYAARLSKRLAG